MATIINASIDLNKLNKAKIIEGKNGAKYYNISIVVNDEKNSYGQDVSISDSQTAEERTNKSPKIYIGNGKTTWKSESIAPKQEMSETMKNSIADSFLDGLNNDLPF
jgi:hypothetical protein